MDIYTDPDGKKWRKTTGYNGHRKGADGYMHYDVHTGRGTRTIWIEYVPAPPREFCDDCGCDTLSGYHQNICPNIDRSNA